MVIQQHDGERRRARLYRQDHQVGDRAVDGVFGPEQRLTRLADEISGSRDGGEITPLLATTNGTLVQISDDVLPVGEVHAAGTGIVLEQAIDEGGGVGGSEVL